MDLHELIRTVATGKTGFVATSASMTDLLAFQQAVTAAREAYSLGYVDYFKPHLETYSGHRFCDAFLISKVTDQGRRYAQLNDLAV
jgi:hypothetical protein